MADILSIVNQVDPLENELVAPQAILPLQFYGARRAISELESLHRLMLAMLVDAVRCFQNKYAALQPASRQEFAEVRSWIFSDTDDGPFSFISVCEALNIEPQAIRKVLARWEEKRLFTGKPRMIRRTSPPAKRISA